MPPDAAMQQAALQQIDRKIDQEEVARAQYDREHAKSDAILKAKAAIAGYDGTPRDRSGTASGVVGTHDRGSMEKGLHKKSDKVKGTKTTKEAAKFTKQLASESKTDQTGGDAADLEAANDAPQVEAPTSDGGIDAAPGPSGGGSDAGGSAQATATGGGSGAGTSDAGNSLTNAPPSIFSDAIDTAGKDLTEAGKKEAEAKKAALPEFKAKIEAPDAAEKKVIDSSPGDKSLNQGGEGENASAPTLTKAAPKKLKKKKPGADMASAQAESPPDVLAHLFADSLAKIDTESTTSTNPGAAPTVKFAGNSDPARAGKETVEADTKIAEAHASTAAAIAARPGTDEIQPIDIDQTVEPAEIPMPEVAEVPVDAGMAEYEAKMEEHGQAVGDAADDIQGAEFDAKLEEAQAAIDSAVGDRDTDYAAKVDDSAKEVDELNKKAAEDQDKAVDDARKDVQAKHEDTKKKQDQELGKAKGKSDKARKDAEKKIEGRRKADDKSIQQKYKDAEKKAKAEKQKAESKAAAEKKKAEAKKSDSGWFSSMASAISSFVDGIASAVTKVFDAMASAVAGILNAVKDAATSMIDAAISFATSTLDALGGVLKGLVDNLIGDIFPGLAQALNDAIDSAVNLATDAVNAIGEQLKNGVAAAIDGLNGAIQAVMNAYKAAITSALAIASAVVSGDWEKALLVLLEGALTLAGIDKAQFYELVGQGTDTIKSIVDDPGSFIGNLIDAVGQGFGNFAGNFGTHLMNGAIDWLTGSLGEAGISLPDTWDAMGIFGLVMDVMGLSVDKLKDKVGEKIGEENMALLETAWGYVEATIQGGLTGLWEHVQGQLGGLWDGLIDAALGFLMEKVVTAAVTKIASMFSPVGAIVQAILTAWNVYQFVQEQAQRIMSLVTSVVSSMAQIVAGQLGPAAGMIEESLAKLVPVAISLLANLLGLGGISQKVKEIVESLQAQVDKGIDFALDKLLELGKAAFDAFKETGGTKPEGQEPNEMPDPAQLPRETIATTLGGMNLTFDAERGGQGATAMIDGKWAGKVAASAIPAMKTESEKMEGPGKAEASGALDGARSQVASVDSQAGKYIRGEEEGLGSLQSAMANLAAQILTAVNAIADETGGDKAASVQSHESMASSAARVMEEPVTGVTSYAAWHRELQTRATQQEQRNQGNLETDVKIDITVGPDVLSGLRDGGFDVDIEIGPNTTTYDPDTPLTDPGFDPRLSLTSERFKQAKKNLEPIAAEIGMTSAQVDAAIEAIWVNTMTLLKSTNASVDYKKIADSEEKTEANPLARVDLQSAAIEKIRKDLRPIGQFIDTWMRAQEAANGDGTWAFWSGRPAMDVAKNNDGICLETSMLGAVFDSHKSGPSNNTELWVALSEAYAFYAAQNFKDKTFVGYLGAPIEDRSIFNQVEQPTFELFTAGQTPEPTITWYACAANVVKGKPGWIQKHLETTHDGKKGVFASQTGLRGREAMADKAATYQERIKVGEDPRMAPDPLKPVKENIKKLGEELRGGNPRDNGWITKAKEALNEFNAWCDADQGGVITDSLAKGLVDKAAENIVWTLYDAKYEPVESLDDLTTKYGEHEVLMDKWEELVTLSGASKKADSVKELVADLKAAQKATRKVLEVVNNREPTNRALVKTRYDDSSTLVDSIEWDGLKKSMKPAFVPAWQDAFARAAEAMKTEERWTRIAVGEDENTDNLWSDSSDVDKIKADAEAWQKLTGEMWPKRIGRSSSLFDEHLFRMGQAAVVIPIKPELEKFLAKQPDDVRQANEALKENLQALAEGFTGEQEGAWKRAFDAFADRLDDKYVSKAEMRVIAQECFSDFFGKMAYATPAGWLQLVYKMADKVHEGITQENGGDDHETDQVMVKKGQTKRLLGGALSLAPIPLLGPAMNGIGRYQVSYAQKGNKLRAVGEALAEFVLLGALQIFSGGIGNALLTVTDLPVQEIVQGAGAAGAIGGAASNAEIKEAAQAIEALNEINGRIAEQEFKTPGDIARVLLYLHQKATSGDVA